MDKVKTGDEVKVMNKLAYAAKVVLDDSLGTKAGERVLIVMDEPLRAIGGALWEAAQELKAETVLLEMLPRQSSGEEPPMMVAQAMLAADVIVLATSKSLSHTRARKEANNRGARVASMPSITEEAMIRTLAGVNQDLAKRAKKYADVLNSAKEVHITTPIGTDLTFSIEGRKAINDSGLLFSPGSFGNLPAGEAFVAPVEGTAAGVLVIDGSMAGIGLIKEPIRIKVEKGLAVNISGGKEAAQLETLINPHGLAARNIAELGIGLNEHAQLTGLVLEDEKALGTIHIALGDNSTFGGKVEVASHLDGVILQPTLWLDGQKVIEDGRLLDCLF